MASIAVLLIALIAIIISMLNSPEYRAARESRNSALKTLLSRRPDNPAGNSLNLNLIAGELRKPYESGGSLDNLYHFLSKDPGRRDFARAEDRRRAEEYLSGSTGVRAEYYAEELKRFDNGNNLPEWTPEYIGKVRALFDNVCDDLLIISGIPETLTSLPFPEAEEDSITLKTEKAIKAFADKWIPRGETRSSYDVDREKIRNFLLGKKRFGKRMTGIDDAWKELAASLYNLSVNSHWKIAVHYYPELESGLDELTTIVLAADIYRRSEDLMKLVSGSGTAEIMRLPEFSYYKNIPELTGQLKSDNPEDVTMFFVKVNIGYTFRDSRTQTWLNRRKDWMTDYFNLFFSKKDLAAFTEKSYPGWSLALLKGSGLHEINKKMVQDLPFGKRKVFGVRDLALVKLNLLTNP